MTQGVGWLAAGVTIVAIAIGCRRVERESVSLSERMTDHFDQVLVIRQAVIDGDLELARQTSRAIADQPVPPGVSSSSRSLVGDMRRVARDLAKAPGLGEAAAELGRLAHACGRCHDAEDARPGFPIDVAELNDANLPPSLETVPHMRRHEWAAARLWEGLIGPSDRRWNWGAMSLQSAALVGENLSMDQPAVNLSQLAVRVHEIGIEATNTVNRERRAQLYAELIASCAACHSGIRD